jgi:hypothetical protein
VSDDGGDSDPVDRRAMAAARLLETETAEEPSRRERRAEQRQRRAPRSESTGPTRRSILWALVFALLGAVATVASAAGVVPAAQQGVVAALGGASVFLALLTLALAPAGHPDRDAALFDRLAGNHERAVADLGLSSVQFYVPTGDSPPVRLFVPRDPDAPVPSVDKLSATFVGRRAGGELLGMALDPTGLALLQEADLTLADEPRTLAGALCGALVDRLEVAEIAQPNVDVATGRATVAFRGTAYGPVESFDHPARSFVGVGLALGLARPVRMEVIETADGEFRVRYSWETA